MARLAGPAAIIFLMALGCGGGAARTDAGTGAGRDGAGPVDARVDADVDPACVGLSEGMACDQLGPLGSKASCQGGHCLPGCQGDPTRSPCTTFYDLPKSCCGTDERCCWVEFETVGCRPAASPCPRLCGESFQIWECPADAACVFQHPFADSVPDAGTCGEWHRPTSSFPNPTGCTTACPVEAQCGRDCCGINTRCYAPDGGFTCCVASPWDAGVGD